MTGLAQLKALASLKRLDLAGTDVGDKGLPHLAELSGLTSAFAQLHARSPMRRMPNLEKLVELEELGLIRTRVTDKSMAVIGRFARLIDLNLDYTDVGDKGFEALGGLIKAPAAEPRQHQRHRCLGKAAQRVQATPEAEPLSHIFHRKGLSRQIHEAVPDCEIIFDPKSSDPKRRRS